MHLGSIFSCPTCFDAALPNVDYDRRHFIPAEHSPDSGAALIFLSGAGGDGMGRKMMSYLVA